MLSLSESKPKRPMSASPALLGEVGVVFRRLDGRRLRGLAIFLAAVAAAYSLVFVELFRFAAQRSELYSHIFLIPFIAAYLAGLKVGELPENTDTARRAGALVAAFAAGWLVLALSARRAGETPQADYLALAVVSVLVWAAAGVLWFFGASFLRVLAFPLGFLLFMAPFPVAVENGIEAFFQRTSAEAAYALMNLTGLTVSRDGLFFRLPGITLEVAAECSGIRSSYMLFITSIVAGCILLQRQWTRATLALVVIPLGIVRNGLRIVSIALLCVHVSPSMIDSPIHHRGGPIFFGLSLIPFFAALLLLRRWEKKRRQPPTATSADAPR